MNLALYCSDQRLRRAFEREAGAAGIEVGAFDIVSALRPASRVAAIIVWPLGRTDRAAREVLEYLALHPGRPEVHVIAPDGDHWGPAWTADGSWQVWREMPRIEAIVERIARFLPRDRGRAAGTREFRAQPRMNIASRATELLEVFAPLPVAVNGESPWRRTEAAIAAARREGLLSDGSAFPLSFNLPGTSVQQWRDARYARAVVDALAEQIGRTTLEIDAPAEPDSMRFRRLCAALRERGARVAVNVPSAPLDVHGLLPWCDELIMPPAMTSAVLSCPGHADAFRAYCAHAKRIGVKVGAVGVEDAPTVAWLSEHGCDWIQGWYCAPPMAFADIERWQAAHPPDGAGRKRLT